jgi:3-oxoacyl-[acyl-carrier-protein] synthase III
MNKIEYYLPEGVLTNADISKRFAEWDYESFEKKIGIKKRHITSVDETALDLAYQAALKVFQNFDKSKIDFVLLCTQSPDYFLPTTACILQDRLGLSKSCAALDFNLGCSGYIYGLSLAKGLLESEIASNILLIMTETYSKYIHPNDRTNISIFGDAAAATIITQEDVLKIGKFVLKTDGSGYDKLIVRNGGSRCIFDNNAVEKVYGENNTYTDNNLYMNGPDIFSFTIDNIPPLIDETLLKNGLSMDNIDYFVFHQANAFMLDFLRKIIRIPKEKFYVNLAESGNTVSATIPIALKSLLDSGTLNAGNKVLLAGFGVGLSWGATVIEI